MPQLLIMLVAILGADAKIVAPDSAPANQLVLIDGSDSVGSLEWSVSDSEVTVFRSPDGKQIAVRSQSARFAKIKLIATDNAGKSSDVAVIEFIGSKPPTPLPDTPKPMPIEPKPEGRFAIAKPARDKAAEVKVETGDQRKTEALLLAAKLTNVRDRIQSGAIKTEDPGAVMQAIRFANAELPRDVQARWHGWGTWWGQTLFGHWKAGKLKASNDWYDVLDETIAGLKGV